MSKLKIPTLQHLARNWHESAGDVERSLIQLVDNTPTFNYNCLNEAARDLLLFGVGYDQLAEGVERVEKREHVRKILLEVLQLMYTHFSSLQPDFVHAVEPQSYRLSTKHIVPFKPPLVYGLGGQLYFPWLSYWKRNPLAGDRLSLFVTLVEEMLAQDPDLEAAKFQILDFSAADSSEPRSLAVIDSHDVPRLSRGRVREMLEIFVEGYERAQLTLEKRSAERAASGDSVYINSDQLVLWDS